MRGVRFWGRFSCYLGLKCGPDRTNGPDSRFRLKSGLEKRTERRHLTWYGGIRTYVRCVSSTGQTAVLPHLSPPAVHTVGSCADSRLRSTGSVSWPSTCRAVGLTCIPLVAETLGGLAEHFISIIQVIGRSIRLRSGAERDSDTTQHLYGNASHSATCTGWTHLDCFLFKWVLQIIFLGILITFIKRKMYCTGVYVLVGRPCPLLLQVGNQAYPEFCSGLVRKSDEYHY